MRWLAVVGAAACACQGSEHGEHGELAKLAPARRDVSAFVGSAQRAAIGDVDGDGKPEIVLADPERLWVTDAAGRELAALDAPGGIEVLVVARLPGDARAEIFAGWGMSREHKTAGARISAYRLDGGKLVEDLIVAPETPRAEVTAIVPGPDGKVVVAYYDSKYTVHSAYATREGSGSGWALAPIATIRMAASYARADVDGDGALDLIVGRIYGDDRGVDGDAFVLRADGTRVMIPTTRGVRELAAVDTDGDGRAEVYLADGWHQDYARHAQGLLTAATVDAAGVVHAAVVEDTAGQYTVGRILPAKIGGSVALVTAGNKAVRVYRRGGGGAWIGSDVAGVARDIAVGDLDGRPGDEILVIGDHSEVITLR